MAELRRTLAGVASATSLRKAPRGSVSTKSASFDWQILAADFAIIALGLGVLRPALHLVDWAGLGARSFGGFWAPGPSVLGHAAMLPLAFALCGALAAVWYFWFRGHYLRRRSSWDRLGDLAFVSGALIAVELLAAWRQVPGTLPLPALLLLWTALGGLLLAGRLGLRRLLERQGRWRRPAVVLGNGARAQDVARAVAEDDDLGLSVTHILEISGSKDLGSKDLGSKDLGSKNGDRPATAMVAGREVPVLATQDPLAALFLRFRDHVILIAPQPEQFAAVDKLVPTLTSLCPTVGVALPTVGLAVEGASPQVLLKRDVALVWMQNRLMRPEWRVLKRCFDMLAAAGILIVTAPLLLGVALLIRCLDGAPVFFAQERVGRHGKIFRMVKFRTMVKDAEGILAEWKAEHPERWAAYKDNNFKLSDDPRVTPLGRLLRQTSIDELPQLWNALKGDMSLVGPRPLLRREVGDYGGNIQLYLTARPGLSGLWQVSGRSETRFSDRAQLDGWYVRNWSFWYDIVILFKTVRIVLGRGGAY